MSAIFSDNFMDNLESNPILAASQIAEQFLNYLDEFRANRPGAEPPLDDYLEAFGTLSGVISGTPLANDAPNLIDLDIDSFAKSLHDFMVRIAKSKDVALFKVHAARRRIETAYTTLQRYEFSGGDYEKIQLLVNDLRSNISASDLFDPDHKRRLLRRLESLQQELHKRMSSLDSFWGFVGEAGVLLGKFGKDAKPFTDRISDMVKVVWRTQARVEELESDAPFPQLTDQSDDEAEK